MPVLYGNETKFGSSNWWYPSERRIVAFQSHIPKLQARLRFSMRQSAFSPANIADFHYVLLWTHPHN
jgi:hypothetical protein